MTFDPSDFASQVSYPWLPDQGDGSFRNPIICADYSDPDLIRDGDDFYLVSSSFNCTPGLPILHSRDLVNWTIINHAIKNLPDESYNAVRAGCGVWAPSIRKHAGKFWIFFPTPDEGIYVTTADHPAKEWSPPHLLLAGKGLIDPCPLWDDDGKAYLVHAYAQSRSGIKHQLRVRPMSPDAKQILGAGKVVFDDPKNQPTLEGPKFLKKDGWYYILAPAGGVETGWQLVLRSKNIYGPYEEKKVLEQGRTPINGPHQGGLEQLPNGEWWFVHFQDTKPGPYGRVLHLQPVEWKSDWPMMGMNGTADGIHQPVGRFRLPLNGTSQKPFAPQTSDEFDSPKLGLQWQWFANHKDNWASLVERAGWLRLRSQPVDSTDLSQTPNLLLQKTPAREFSVETSLQFAPKGKNEMAGLTVVGRNHAAIAIRNNGDQNELVMIIDGKIQVLAKLETANIRLRLQMADGGACTFAYAACNEPFKLVGPTFQAREGVWIGAKVGLFSIATAYTSQESGHTDFDYFRFSKIEK